MNRLMRAGQFFQQVTMDELQATTPRVPYTFNWQFRHPSDVNRLLYAHPALNPELPWEKVYVDCNSQRLFAAGVPTGTGSNPA